MGSLNKPGTRPRNEKWVLFLAVFIFFVHKLTLPQHFAPLRESSVFDCLKVKCSEKVSSISTDSKKGYNKIAQRIDLTNVWERLPLLIACIKWYQCLLILFDYRWFVWTCDLVPWQVTFSSITLDDLLSSCPLLSVSLTLRLNQLDACQVDWESKYALLGEFVCQVKRKRLKHFLLNIVSHVDGEMSFTQFCFSTRKLSLGLSKDPVSLSTTRKNIFTGHWYFVSHLVVIIFTFTSHSEYLKYFFLSFSCKITETKA